ncbi:MAG: hypothetical protein ABSG59_18905 [Verrucomicrobiota bacterium]|jgi:hypothetical protein
MRTMKKRLISLLAIAGLVCLAGAGCSNHDIDTAKVRQALQSVGGETKEQLELGLAAIDSSNYVAAIKPLEKVAFGAKMDVQQSKVLQETIAKVKYKIAHAK